MRSAEPTGCAEVVLERNARPGRGELSQKTATREGEAPASDATWRSEWLPLASIRIDPSIQMRVAMSEEAIADYEQTYRSQGAMCAVEVVEDPERTRWLWDGFQRFEAAKRADMAQILVHNRPGTRRDAIRLACGANSEHGVRRTNADKRRAVETLLRDSEWGEWSNGQIAEAAHVTPQFVGQMRKELGLSRNSFETLVRRGGQEYQMDTGAIAAANQARAQKNKGACAKPVGKPTEAQEQVVLPPAPLEELAFSDHTSDSLKKANIQTLADLVQSTEAALIAIPNIEWQSLVEVREKLAGLGERLAGPVLEWPTDGNENEAEPPLMPPRAAPEPWMWVRMEDQGGTALWVPDWPEEGTNAECAEWASGFVTRLHMEAGLEALAEIARQCLVELLTRGRPDPVRRLVESAANALQGREVARDQAASG
jgi:hypothetical protein